MSEPWRKHQAPSCTTTKRQSPPLLSLHEPPSSYCHNVGGVEGLAGYKDPLKTTRDVCKAHLCLYKHIQYVTMSDIFCVSPDTNAVEEPKGKGRKLDKGKSMIAQSHSI